MEKTREITGYFADVETTEEHKGYFCSVGEALTIVILGSICGLKNVSQIHQWAANSRTREFLAKYFGIDRVPCYYWMLCLLKLIEPKSLNRCFTNWVQSMLPDSKKGLTLSVDGKTVRSTEKMDSYESPLHIVSAHIAELGITFGQCAVRDKSNEIPAVQELLNLLDIEGCIVVADALNCQKETAKVIISGKADYLLSVKDNHPTLKKDIEDFVQDDSLRKTMDSHEITEKNRDRIETRTAYSTNDISWLYGKDEWKNLTCIGAVHTQFTTKKGTTDEWHYFISSRELSAEELLRHARFEWSVESMHWLLDVHFDEDLCLVENVNLQKNLNIVRKIALNTVKLDKDKKNIKRPLSKIMFDCLLDPHSLLPILDFGIL
jgi:predicted transposase YbfD/YdcC